MKHVTIDDIKPGDVLARPVLFRGSILLDIGTVLTEEYIRSLKKRDISSVYIEDSGAETDGSDIDELVD